MASLGRGETGDRLRRLIEFDPNWEDERVLTARRGEERVAVITVLRREERLLDHAVPAGGLAQLSPPEERDRRLATSLTDRACEQMQALGLDLAIAFPGDSAAGVGLLCSSRLVCLGG